MIEPDVDQIEIFVDALFRYSSGKGYVSLRSFYETDSAKPFRITPTGMSGGAAFLITAAVDDARRAANDPKPVVFCPPIATFIGKDRARESDILEGFALSVECDQTPQLAKLKLEQILGPATLVIASGGTWTDPQTGEIEDKLHLHWRLAKPAQGAELTKLKEARDLAARLVGGDPSNKPVAHPIRWPGSWHRKAEPRLCQIKESDPDREIDLAAALAALQAATPPPAASNKANGPEPEQSSEWAGLIAGLLTGTDYHNASVRMAMKLLRAGMVDAAAVNLIRAFMDASAGPRDERWQTRHADIPRSVATAREKLDATVERPAGCNRHTPGDEPPPAMRTSSASWTLPRLAGHLLRHYVDPTVALDLLLAWNATRCQPPQPGSEVIRIVNWVAGKELARRKSA